VVVIGVFQAGGSLYSQISGGRGHRPPTSRLIILSCGIKRLGVYSFVSSQSTRVSDRRSDRGTEGRRDGQTDGENYDPQDRASIAVSRSNNNNNNYNYNNNRTVEPPLIVCGCLGCKLSHNDDAEI